MAGKDAELPTYELTAPVLTPAGAHQLGLSIRRGRNVLRFTLEFTLAQGKIVLLRNSRA